MRFASADFAGEGSLVSMERLRDGTVYLCLDYDFFDEMVTHGNWTGHCEFFDDSPPEFGPEFADANDAVLWWRARGARSKETASHKVLSGCKARWSRNAVS